jgi:predicted O-methyltransferase YrrM
LADKACPDVKSSTLSGVVLASKMEVLELELQLKKIQTEIIARKIEPTNPAPTETTKLFVPPGHFYSPIVNRAVAERQFRLLKAKPQSASLKNVTIDKRAMYDMWRRLLPFMLDHPFLDRQPTELRYFFENPAYSYGDALILQSMLRLHRPKRLIEIGSGWSSACTLDTIDRYLDGACQVTFIEPFPQLLFELVGKKNKSHMVIASQVQDVSLEVFDQLKARDFLFIDSTHVLSTGSDVHFELFEILPRLRKGVIVHFHDIFWPFEYPASWALDENRSWNELYAIRLLLSDDSRWKVQFFNDYFSTFSRDEIERSCPQFLKNSGGALWIERL